MANISDITAQPILTADYPAPCVENNRDYAEYAEPSISLASAGFAAQQQGAPVTILTNVQGNLAKTFGRAQDGTIKKTAAAHLARGNFVVRYVDDLHALDAVLNALTPAQAVTFGRPDADRGDVVASKLLDSTPGAISRTRDYWKFAPGAGVMMLDYDPAKEGEPFTPSALVCALLQACPFIAGVGLLWRPSASSGVDGAGIRGQRLYLIIDDAREIERVGQSIFDRLWLAGYGYFAISKSGILLPRSPVDAAVWRPEGLDLAARPVLSDAVTRTEYPSQVHGGGRLSASDVVELSPQEATTLAAMKDEKRTAMQDAVASVQLAWKGAAKPLIKQRLANLNKDCSDEPVGMLLDRAVDDHLLMGDWPLITPTGTVITVGAVLDAPEKWHNTRWADPLEPETDPRVAWLNLRSGGRPYLYSHLHGGVRYWLERAPALIRVHDGELPRIVDTLAELLQKGGEVYQRAGAMVRITDDAHIVSARQPWFLVHAQRICRFERFDGRRKEYVPTGCPSDVAAGVLALASHHSMPNLAAIRTAPTCDLSGRVIEMPGYDEQTQLLLLNNTQHAWPPIPSAPSRDDLVAAMTVLWAPFARFPYAGPEDASVALAAVLTTAVRPCLGTAPGFGFSATAAGTGKTLLAKCIGTLYDGVAPAPCAPIVHEEEWAKMLFSAVLGGTGTLLFDNAEHAIESASLCAATTSSSLKGRVLGESREAQAEHRLLILATGNGLRFVGDLNRRILVCRLDAKMEARQIVGREFDVDPLAYCMRNRVQITVAALTLIRGYATAGFPWVCDGLSSMDDWNRVVRATIVWLIKKGLAPKFVDPKTALDRDVGNDPDAAKLSGLLAAIHDVHSLGRRFSVAELIESAGRASNRPLFDVLLEIAGEHDKINPRRLGRWMEIRENRIIDGNKLVRDGKTRTNTAAWSVSTM